MTPAQLDGMNAAAERLGLCGQWCVLDPISDAVEGGVRTVRAICVEHGVKEATVPMRSVRGRVTGLHG